MKKKTKATKKDITLKKMILAWIEGIDLERPTYNTKFSNSPLGESLIKVLKLYEDK